MNRWIIATAVMGVMAVPVFGQNAAQETKPGVTEPTPPAAATGRFTGIKGTGAPVPARGQVLTDDVAIEPAGLPAVQRAVVKPIFVDAVKHEKVTYLGVVTSSAAPAMREQLKLGKGVGLVVDSVENGTAAETAGVKQHDVLEKLNDQWLINTEQLTALLRSMKAGDEVTLSVIRQGERQAIKAKLGEKEIDMGGGVINFNIAVPPAPQGGGMPGAGVFGGGNGDVIFLGGRNNGGVGNPAAMANVMVRTLDGKQTTEWADDQYRISLEREGDKTSKVTVTDAKTGKIILTGAPPAADDPVLKALPQLQEKLKRAEIAAAVPPQIVVADRIMMGTAARGKVAQWQDADHILMMRVVGTKPIYLLALSKKDGRTLYDGPVMTEEQRQSIPAEVGEQFELLVAHPEQIKEFGAKKEEPTKKEEPKK